MNHIDDPRQAAAELGVDLPCGFLYLGGGQAMAVGTAEELRAAAAILNRLDGVPVTDCWPPEPEPDPRPLSELLAAWEAECGRRPPIWNMGIKRIVEVLDHVPEELTAAERMVLVAIAENINDADPKRETWPDFNAGVLARRTGLTGDGALKRALQRLAKRGMEVRVPIATGKDGRLLYAVPGRQCRYRLPVLTGEVGASPGVTEGGTTVPPRAPQGGTTVPPGGTTVPPKGGPQSRLAGPQSPPSPPPHSPHSSLSVAEQVVRDSGVVAEDERETFIDWINNNHSPRGPAWWRTVARNGDLRDLAEKWRADQPAVKPALLAWCGRCGDDNPAARFNANFRLLDGAPCLDCHPDARRSKTA
ncbi:hypothetical protein [Streptomyces sp. NPDC055085]